MSLLSTLRLALARALKTLMSPLTAPEASRDSVWNQPLTGDAWIGVFLIAVSLLGLFEVSQRL